MEWRAEHDSLREYPVKYVELELKNPHDSPEVVVFMLLLPLNEVVYFKPDSKKHLGCYFETFLSGKVFFLSLSQTSSLLLVRDDFSQAGGGTVRF